MHTITKAGPADMDELLTMSLDLWPDYVADELEATLREVIESEKSTVLLYRLDTGSIAFLYMGIRVDYVEGADSSPTGFVEGIYVKPGYRRQGIARMLLAAGEAWVREKGCRQVGSDIYIDNTDSYGFHTRAGFREAGRLIAFIKDL